MEIELLIFIVLGNLFRALKRWNLKLPQAAFLVYFLIYYKHIQFQTKM